ncbi:unnamed protein product [Chilo suppressalis]|uniref:Follicular epithelium yolk protein subunit n=1 Tax=Chilo suppressalis TaxID=168631 RepID=A0ABN8LA07_CHISP|nr:unnamed protein product [Chilo suppressalis]
MTRCHVNVTASMIEGMSAVDIAGESVDVISDQEIHTFGLGESPLKDAVERYSGGRPGDVYLKSPTPWNDLYKVYNWSEVRRTLYPRSARVLGVTSQPVIVSVQEFSNHSSVVGTYNAGITHQVEQTVSNTWSKGGELTVGTEISYNIDMQVATVGGSASMSFGSSWGHDRTNSKSVTVGASSAIEVELAPGQAAIATLQAIRATVEVEVDYTATLHGAVACNYPDKHNDHHFWSYDINEVMGAAGMNKNIDSTERMRIDFYSDAKVMLRDRDTNADL